MGGEGVRSNVDDKDGEDGELIKSITSFGAIGRTLDFFGAKNLETASFVICDARNGFIVFLRKERPDANSCIRLKSRRIA